MKGQLKFSEAVMERAEMKKKKKLASTRSLTKDLEWGGTQICFGGQSAYTCF